MEIRCGTGAVNSSTCDALFDSISLVSSASGSQKKENFDSGFGRRDTGDAVTFDREVTSFFSSASGFQKKDRSEMSFVHRDTGNVEIFVGEAI